MKTKTKYLCRLILAALFAVTLIGPMTPAFAYRRSSTGEALTTTEDAGNTMTPYNLSVGTTTAVRVYQKTASRVDRKFMVCNDQATSSGYRLLASTSSAINGLATTQDIRTLFHVEAGNCTEIIAPMQDIYAVFKATSTSGSFSGGRAYGYKRYDSSN